MYIEEIIKHALERSVKPKLYDYGFADFTTLPEGNYKGYTHGLAIARKLDDLVINTVAQGPNEFYYVYYNMVNTELDLLARSLDLQLRARGIDCHTSDAAISDSVFENSREAADKKISHRFVAAHAGLGWIGKSSLLVSEKFGPRVRLASILFNAQVNQTRKSYEAGKCGDCSLCVSACPAKAPKNVQWTKEHTREDLINVKSCKSNCKEMSLQNIGEEMSICGICVNVCPSW